METSNTNPDALARMHHRLASLRREYTVGSEQMRALELRQRELQNTLLRIDGAIQVLEELVQQTPPGEPRD